MDMIVIADDDTMAAFRLAGVTRVYDQQAAPAQLGAIMADSRAGVVIVTEVFADQHRAQMERLRPAKSVTPIIVEVPAVAGKIAGRPDRMQELMRRAVGIDMQPSV